MEQATYTNIYERIYRRAVSRRNVRDPVVLKTSSSGLFAWNWNWKSR